MFVILEAEKMATKEEAHAYLREILELPDYYGNNLDALYECLTEMRDLQVGFADAEECLGSGTYFDKIYDVFVEAAEDNPRLEIVEEAKTDDINVADVEANMRIGALEAGGTKMVCAIGDGAGNILKRISIPTETPELTMPKMIDFFRAEKIERLGIGCFGPIAPDKSSANYGCITSTPKLAWQNFNIVKAFEEALSVPVGFDTDVNAAALGEATYGISKGLDTSIYMTVGTGIGVGVYMDGKLLHGMMHTEAGHISLKRHEKDSFAGGCPFHGDCFEGLASGPAIEKRWGREAAALVDTEEVWEMEAFYIAQACVNFCMTYSPRRIVLGGGVLKQEKLLPMIRKEFARLMADYIVTEELKDLDTYIVPASLNDNQAVLGCFMLALQA